MRSGEGLKAAPPGQSRAQQERQHARSVDEIAVPICARCVCLAQRNSWLLTSSLTSLERLRGNGPGLLEGARKAKMGLEVKDRG